MGIGNKTMIILKISSFISSHIIKKKLFFIAGLLCFTFLSCKKGDQFDCIKSTGKIKQEVRQVAPFSTIHLEDNINLILVNGNSSFIKIEAGENLQKKITTKTEGGHLFIRNENTCNWVRSYKKLIKVYVGIDQIYDIFHTGYGDISSEGTLNKNSLIIHHYSSGNIDVNVNSQKLWIDMDRLATFTIKGSADTVNALTYHLSNLNTENLQCHAFYLNTKSQGEARIRTDNILSVTIENEGNVYYYGNPTTVGRFGNGSGALIKAD
jgi:hypothetical protein